MCSPTMRRGVHFKALPASEYRMKEYTRRKWVRKFLYLALLPELIDIIIEYSRNVRLPPKNHSSARERHHYLYTLPDVVLEPHVKIANMNNCTHNSESTHTIAKPKHRNIVRFVESNWTNMPVAVLFCAKCGRPRYCAAEIRLTPHHLAIHVQVPGVDSIVIINYPPCQN